MRKLVLTGATGGLGTEVVRALAADWECVVLYRSESSLASLRQSLGPIEVTAISADLTDSQSVRRAMQSIERPYGLVHLAGGFSGGKLLDTSDETWAQMIGLNLTGAFVAVREAVRVMDPNRPGRIIAIGSEAALTRKPGTLAYTVSKGALNVLLEIVAKELRETKITVNALLPSSLDTPAMRAFASREELVPLDRVAAALRFLLSDEAASVHGALIPLSAR